MNMLNGIEILNKVELVKTVNNKINGTAIVVLFILLLISTAFALIFISNDVEMGVTISVICMAVFGIAMITCVIIDESLSKQVPTGKYEYQVTISDDVSMTEFNERYEVIKVEGKIWTIVEKE